MYRTIQQSLLSRLQAILLAKYDTTIATLVVEQPPNIALGELALPVAFELAKRLRKAPRVIATELAAELTAVLPELEGVASVEVAGAGYLNLRLNRAAVAREIAKDKHADVGGPGFRLVEHTSINPNKAAHIGHLRNAILGDTFQRLLRPDSYKRGYEVGVQNYIDNTGVQVADVVVGLVHLEGKTLESTRELLADLRARGERIDFYCWELYARVSQWYTADPAEAAARKQLRLDTLHALETGGNDTAEIADLISTAVLHRHLETMERLSIEYDFLPRESEILHLHFWDAARELMIAKGVLYEETEGKNKGCMVMRRAGSEVAAGTTDEDAKVIVRSNGTVTYVGKDIAYHLWKFGLLPGKDFGYVKFHEYPTHTCWISTDGVSDPSHPVFGKADAIYNVIDSRQNDPQNNVVQALLGMGFTDAAERYTHFSYEMVALTPRCAIELGYTISEEDKAKAYIEVSGRKGFGVKADDLLDQLIAAAQAEVDTRHPDLGDEARRTIATQIGVGALRYFMLRFTRNTVIAFDFKDALSFEGETGPYVQYAIVRAANIFRKAETTAEASFAAIADLDLSSILDSEEGTSLWETWLLASKLTLMIEQCIATAEPAYLAKYAFQLAQQFNNFYHRHHVLKETDASRRTLLLATAAVAQREMTRALGYLGIEAPERM
ncbi:MULTISPECIES: arginine--tRNA ligase [Acidobacteriaceae]|uniref:arginine--tRNA ligase n=1 Tax=Acidobacteriaceae TaxID=204434 RepID=UPI00131AAA45|nr:MULTISPECIES: DALR anticodon-binding domain-containing protein [Acidobacteriaceae]MDW5266629.1 DALR anticodon-binding domain-containing protein [Edaphobacter sp.]